LKGNTSLKFFHLKHSRIDQQHRWLKSDQKSTWICLFGCAVLGMLAVLYATQLGPGLGGDAAIYLTSARNMIAGQGLGIWDPENKFQLLPYFPPFFPIVLGIMGILQIPMVEGARWLHALLFGATILISGLLLYRTSRSACLSIILSAVIAFSPIMSHVFMWAMSEPIYLFVGILCLWFLLKYLETPLRIFLILAAMAAGISFFTRYLGISFVLLGAFAILLMTRTRFISRVGQLAIFLLVSCTPIGLWVIYDRMSTGTVSSRSVTTGSSLPVQLTSLAHGIREVFASWFIPFSWVEAPPYPAYLNTVVLIAIFGIVFAVALALLSWQSKRLAHWLASAEARLWVLTMVFLIINVGVISGVYLLTYPPITLDNRMFSASYLAMILLFFVQGHLLLQKWPSKVWLKVAVYLVYAVLLATYLYRTPRTMAQIHNDGLGYNSSAWLASDTIQAVNRLPESLPVVSNDVAALMYFTDIRPYTFSEIYLAQPLIIFTRFGDDPSDRAQEAFREGAALVLFNSLEDELSFLYGPRTQERIARLTEGLHVHYRGSDGAIYFYRESGGN
jgi:hypothetical protein